MQYGRPLPEARSLSAARDVCDVDDANTVSLGVQQSRETVGELLLRLDAAQSNVKSEEVAPLPDWADEFDASSSVHVTAHMRQRLGDEKLKKLGDLERLLPRGGVSNHS